MSMSRLLIPFAMLTRSAVAGAASAATVSSAGKALPSDLTCPGTPECSGHGICKAASGAAAAQSQCHCAEGYFGHDCGHRHHDCAKLRSCSDCQHAANQRYCGWCVEDRYCVPKHVHAALLRKGKGCAAWYEDTCPARKGGISSSAGGGMGRNGTVSSSSTTVTLSAATSNASMASESFLEEWGDDRSVALAEALVEMIDAAAGEGASTWLGMTMLLGSCAFIVVCTLREKRAQERRERFEKFMAVADEGETLRGTSTPWGGLTTPRRAMAQGGRFSCATPSSMLAATLEDDGGVLLGRARALADAIGVGAGSGNNMAAAAQSADDAATCAGGGLSAATDSASAADFSSACGRITMPKRISEREARIAADAQEEAWKASMKAAALRDMEERKERKRRMADKSRELALQAERDTAEQWAREELRRRAREAAEQGLVEGADEGEASPQFATGGTAAGPSPSPAQPAALAKAEAEFLEALDAL